MHCKKRTGDLDFPGAVQRALRESFPNATLGNEPFHCESESLIA